MNKLWRTLQAVIGVVFLIVFLLFCIYNLDSTEIEFFTLKMRVPLFLVLIGTLLLGIFIGYVFALYNSLKNNKEENDSTIISS